MKMYFFRVYFVVTSVVAWLQGCETLLTKCASVGQSFDPSGHLVFHLVLHVLGWCMRMKWDRLIHVCSNSYVPLETALEICGLKRGSSWPRGTHDQTYVAFVNFTALNAFDNSSNLTMFCSCRSPYRQDSAYAIGTTTVEGRPLMNLTRILDQNI